MVRWIWLLTAVMLLGDVVVMAQTSSAADVASRPGSPDVSVSLADMKEMPSSPGFFILRAKVSADGRQFPLAFGLFLPPAYFQSEARFPVVMTLHNAGFGGRAEAMSFEGLGALCARDHWDPRALEAAPGQPKPASRPANAMNIRTDARFIAIAPQCPKGRAFADPPMPQILSQLITEIGGHFRVDEQRVYLTGFSHGGTSTWKVAEQLPHRFAAIAPLSARATDEPAKTARVFKDVAVYLACGTDEWAQIYCRNMRDALTAAGHSRFVYREVERGTHWCYPIIYTDPQFWDWLLAQKRPLAGAATQP